MKWKKNNEGLYLSPEKERSERAREFKNRPQGDKYLTRKLYRYCPACGAEIKVKRRLKRNDKIGIYRPITAFICSNCKKAWSSEQTVKIWQRLKRSSQKMNTREFKRKIEEDGIK